MRTTLVLLALTLGAGTARAETDASFGRAIELAIGLVTTSALFGAADVGFGVADLTLSMRNQRSRGLAIAEITTMSAQLVFTTAVAAEIGLQHTDSSTTTALVVAATGLIPAALLTHGIYVLATPGRPQTELRLTLVPSVVATDRGGLAPGFAIGGRF